jgi:hypothetical protein
LVDLRRAKLGAKSISFDFAAPALHHIELAQSGSKAQIALRAASA